jgi:hypothetical protein
MRMRHNLGMIMAHQAPTETQHPSAKQDAAFNKRLLSSAQREQLARIQGDGCIAKLDPAS